MSARTPSADALGIAAQWLECYEGEEGSEDTAACREVAAWLHQQAENKSLRDACRSLGMSVSAIRSQVRAAKLARSMTQVAP